MTGTVKGEIGKERLELWLLKTLERTECGTLYWAV